MSAFAAAYGPALAALSIAGSGAFWARRRGRWAPVVGAVAVVSGWGLLAGVARISRPQALPEYLVLPALVAAGVALARLRVDGRVGRWLETGVAVFGGWWLAGSGSGRPEFWRVWFGVCAGAWLLGWSGGRGSRGALVSALTVWGGVAAAGGPAVWVGASLVLVGVGMGMLVAGAAGVVLPGLLAVGTGAVELGAGRLVRGGVGFLDLVCGVALVAPRLLPWLERELGRRFGRWGGVVAPLLLAALAVATAWVGARVLRS